jgi:hypothetical protein
MVIGGIVWFLLPEQRRAKLKILGPHLLSDHTGHDRWRLRVKNSGPYAADNVRMRLTNVTPRPRYPRWQADFPYEVERVGKELSAPPTRLNKHDTEDFEIRTWQGVDGNIYAALNTKDFPPHYLLAIEPDETWRLDYEITAENARHLNVTVQMRVQDCKVIMELMGNAQKAKHPL